MNSTEIKALTQLNGVKLTNPEKNLLVTLVDKYNVVLPDTIESVQVVNKLSGTVALASPIVAALINAVQDAYATYSFCGPMTLNGVKMPVSFYDRVRYLVMKLDNSAYYATLD